MTSLHLCPQNIKAKPQAELPEAHIAIVAVKRRNKEDMRSIQEEMNPLRQRGDLQNHVCGRVAATPLKKLSGSCSSQNFNEKLHTELQGTQARFKTREKRLEDDMKMIREEIHLPQEQEALEKPVSERVIATAVTKLVLSAHLAFPVQGSRGWVMPLSAILLWALSQLL